jgi:hypothetical protein
MHSSVATRAPKQDATAAAPSSRKPFFDVNDFTPAILNQAKSVFHLHGSLANPAGMVVTTRHYIMRNANDRSADDVGQEAGRSPS